MPVKTEEVIVERLRARGVRRGARVDRLRARIVARDLRAPVLAPAVARALAPAGKVPPERAVAVAAARDLGVRLHEVAPTEALLRCVAANARAVEEAGGAPGAAHPAVFRLEAAL